MRNKTLTSLLTLFFLCTGLIRAQEMRTVRGLVSDENGQYIAGATLKADGIDTPFQTNRIGQFDIKLPYTCRTLTAYVDGYAPATMDATPNFILFKMKRQTAESTAAPLAAGAAAAAQADPQADELARLKAQREAERQAQEQARKEAQEQAKAQREAEKQAKIEAQRQAKAQKKAEKQAKKQAKAKKGTNGSLAQQIDFSYAWQPYEGRIVYTNSGGRNYAALHPLQLTYAIGWRFNAMFSLTAGAGFLYNLVSLERKGDFPDTELYGDAKPRSYDVPAFLNFRCHFTDTPVRPYVTLSGGIYALSLAPLMDLGLGVSFRLGGAAALNLAVSARNTPWPLYDESGFYGYPIRIVPAVTAGISF